MQTINVNFKCLTGNQKLLHINEKSLDVYRDYYMSEDMQENRLSKYVTRVELYLYLSKDCKNYLRTLF